MGLTPTILGQRLLGSFTTLPLFLQTARVLLQAAADRSDDGIERGARGVALGTRLGQCARGSVRSDRERGSLTDPGERERHLALEEGVRADAPGRPALAGELGEARHLG